MRPGSPPACVTPTYFQSHQGAQGTDTTDREEKRNTSKMLFLKVKMTLKFLSNYGGNMSLHKTQITGRGKKKTNTNNPKRNWKGDTSQAVPP